MCRSCLLPSLEQGKKMKCKRIFSLILTVVIFGFLAANSAQATAWTVTQLSNDLGGGPHIYGSNVVWSGYDGSDMEIFLYDGNSTTQLTNNSYNDYDPQVYGSNVVWMGEEGWSDAEVFVYDGNSITQLTNNSHIEYPPQVYGYNVVWYGFDGNDFEIFLAQITGDVNGDGWVSSDDLTIIIDNWGQTGLGRGGGDLNGNGVVDGPDYTEVLSNWNLPPEPPSQATPEPATLLLLAFGALLLNRRP